MSTPAGGSGAERSAADGPAGGAVTGARMRGVVTGARVRGAAAVGLLVAGLLLGAFPSLPAGGPVTGTAVAWAGACWLGLEWWLASRRARRTETEAQSLRRRTGDLRHERDELRESRQELESAYSELRVEQAELVNSARLATLGSLVAGIAHELDTPLGAINSNHDTLRRALAHLQDILADEQVDESELEEVRRIVRAVDGVMDTNELAVERMVSLVGSLRSFGRPDASDRDRVDLHAALDDTLEILAHELREGVEVRRDFGELPPVECYPAQLNQVFMNLLLNASQAIEEEGRIELRTSASDSEVRIEIEDTGTGIPEEHLNRIFEPGFTTKGSRMGMGLGLLIAQQVVDRHGGEIDVESEVGVGTRFTITIPARLPDPGPEVGATPG